MLENNTQSKAKFFAQYWGQRVLFEHTSLVNEFSIVEYLEDSYLELTPLSQITDEDLEHVAQIAHERDIKFEIKRRKDIFYATSSPDKVGIYYFISMMPKYATVCSTMNFTKTKDEGHKQFTINIGKVNLSSAKPIAYIMIVDFLRSKGYALPYMGLSVDQQISYGWVKLKEV